MAVSGYGERYLESKKFLDLCNNLEIKLLNSGVDERWLEFLEKKKILFPDFRIKMPLDYAKYNYKRSFEPVRKFNVPKKWQEIHNIFKEMENFEFSLDIFSPIDRNRIKSKYLQQSPTSSFRKWNYSIVIQNKKVKIPWQINYYPYWKAYYLYEITKACTFKYL